MEDKLVKFTYNVDEKYRPQYCSGVYGGISLNENIVMNFFTEGNTIPKETTYFLNDDGTIGEQKESVPKNFENIVVRDVLSGIILNEKTAESIYNWLGNQLLELKNRKTIKEE